MTTVKTGCDIMAISLRIEGDAMAQVVIRNIDDNAIRRLKARAARKGISLERELRIVQPPDRLSPSSQVVVFWDLRVRG